MTRKRLILSLSEVQEKDISIDISVEIPKTKGFRTPVQPDKIEEFTAQLVTIKESFMNEQCELKNEIARLKQAAFNGENNISQ